MSVTRLLKSLKTEGCKLRSFNHNDMYTLKELKKEIERAAQNGDDLGYDVSFADELLSVDYIQELKEVLDDADSYCGRLR